MGMQESGELAQSEQPVAPHEEAQQAPSQTEPQWQIQMRRLETWLERFWYIKLPSLMDPWAPQVAEATADGAWATAWRAVAAYAPMVALVVGFLTPHYWPGIVNVYSESASFMIVVIVGAILSGPVGVMLLAGYVLGDLTVGSQEVPCDYSGIECTIRQFGGRAVSYLLLAIPAITVPELARKLLQEIRLRAIPLPVVRVAARAVLFAAMCGVLVFLWSQAMIVLIRPLFTWAGGLPTTEAIQQVQDHPEWFYTAAAIAAIIRVVLEQVVAPQGPRAAFAADLQRRRQTGEGVGGLWEKIPEWVKVGVSTGMVTLLLAGTYQTWLDLLMVAVVTAFVGAWRSRLIRMIPVPVLWALWVRKVPALLRFLVAPVIGYWISQQILAAQWFEASDGNSLGLRPLMFSALVTVVVFYLLFPVAPAARPSTHLPAQPVPPS